MHPSSFENMQKCFDRYIRGSDLETSDEVVVLDVGGALINGSYSDIFAGPRFTYLGADLNAGPGVSVVLTEPYSIPLNDSSVDVVISGQMLEHCEFFWLTFQEMVRVLKPGGFIFMIAPSTGPIHNYPVDCYRFYPDAYRALAKYTKCNLLDVWMDPRGPWHDLTGVFQRPSLPMPPKPERQEMAPAPSFAPPESPGLPEEEVTGGDGHYQNTLRQLHEVLEPRLYLEIGVRHGQSMALSKCPSVGVDPAPDIRGTLPASVELITKTSDEFFETLPKDKFPHAPDLIFIDGMHLFEYVLRDFMHAERLSAPHTLIVIDDILPNHPSQAARNRHTRVWTGDVWKIHDCLRTYRPDLTLLPLNTTPSGLLLVAGLDPKNRVLWERYNAIHKNYTKSDKVPKDVIARTGVASSTTPAIGAIAEFLKQARTENLKPAKIRQTLRSLVGAPQTTGT